MSAALLALALAIVAWVVARGLRRERRPSASSRTGFYRAVLRNQLLLFALPTVVGLALLGRWSALRALPPEFWSPALWIGASDPSSGIDRDIALEFALVPLVGVVLGAALTLWRHRGGRRPKLSTRFGDFAVLLPLRRSDVGLAVCVALAAGTCEEVFFRLLLPLLLTPYLGGEIAVGLAIVLFGLVHVYQGWVGVAMTMLVGLLLAWIYLLSGSLLIAMWVHVVIDLNALVLRPLLRGFDSPRTD